MLRFQRGENTIPSVIDRSGATARTPRPHPVETQQIAAQFSVYAICIDRINTSVTFTPQPSNFTSKEHV